MKFQPPANVLLRRAQLVLILAALVPTVLMTSTGIILLVLGTGGVAIVVGSLVLALCTSALTGYILGSIFMSRGASLARVQHDFLSSVSHELRTPITSTRMFIDTLKGDRVTDPVEREKCLSILDQEMARLDGLVSKLMALSRIESGRQAFARTPVRLEDVVADALAAFDVVKLGSETRVDVALEPGLEVVGDRDALAQALVNLLTNAWKYTPAQGKRLGVRSLAVGRRHVAVEVTDNGPGIPEDERRRVFGAFERGRAAVETRAAGSGLGLAIVRGIARSHRGQLELVASSPEGGSCFRLTLPRRRGGAAETAKAAERP